MHRPVHLGRAPRWRRASAAITGRLIWSQALGLSGWRLSPSRQRPRRKRRRESPAAEAQGRSEEHTSELQSPYDLVCRLLLEKKKKKTNQTKHKHTKDTR